MIRTIPSATWIRPKENPEGYKAGSVLTYAYKLQGILRIVHGTMDDNVHMQNSIQLIDELEKKGKHFEFMLYPGQRHGFRDADKAKHQQMEAARFYYKYLLEKPMPEGYFSICVFRICSLSWCFYTTRLYENYLYHWNSYLHDLNYVFFPNSVFD